MKSLEIFDAILGDIRAGRYAASGKLPSEAVLCKRFGVARGTVRTALALLRRDGLVATRDGSGSFLTRLAERRTGIIGLIIPDFSKYEFFNLVERGIESRARRMHFEVRLLTAEKTGSDESCEELVEKSRRLVADRVEGVIFRPILGKSGYKVNRKIVEVFQQTGTPLVLLDQDIVQPPGRSEFDLVAVNNVNAGRRIAGHLLSRGYRRIAFLMGSGDARQNANWSNRLFGLGGELALRGVKEAVRILRIAPGDKASLRRVMKTPKFPEAIVCGNDEEASALLSSLLQLGVDIPGDVAIVGFDDLECSRTATPAITTIRQPIELIAATAFKMLLARIRYPSSNPRETYLAAPLVIRKST